MTLSKSFKVNISEVWVKQFVQVLPLVDTSIQKYNETQKTWWERLQPNLRHYPLYLLSKMSKSIPSRPWNISYSEYETLKSYTNKLPYLPFHVKSFLSQTAQMVALFGVLWPLTRMGNRARLRIFPTTMGAVFGLVTLYDQVPFQLRKLENEFDLSQLSRFRITSAVNWVSSMGMIYFARKVPFMRLPFLALSGFYYFRTSIVPIAKNSNV